MYATNNQKTPSVQSTAQNLLNKFTTIGTFLIPFQPKDKQPKDKPNKFLNEEVDPVEQRAVNHRVIQKLLKQKSQNNDRHAQNQLDQQILADNQSQILHCEPNNDVEPRKPTNPLISNLFSSTSGCDAGCSSNSSSSTVGNVTNSNLFLKPQQIPNAQISQHMFFQQPRQGLSGDENASPVPHSDLAQKQHNTD